MTKEERALVSYRLDRAKETIDEARMLFDSGHINAYVNRLYYACFYAVSAFLLTKNFSTSKHGYLRSLFHKELVKTGIVSKELGGHFDRLFDNRQKGDYGDMVRFEADDVAGWLSQTQTFVSHIEKLLSSLLEEK